MAENLQGPQAQKKPYILALDIGTSSVRALLFDAAGSAVPDVKAQQTYKLNTSNDGEVSVDADALVEAVARTIDDALKAAGARAQQIGAVATDTFWHSLMSVDEANRPLMPLLTWEDTRPSQAAAELRARLDEKTIHARTGALLHASYWPAKLRWLAGAQPDMFKRAAQWLSFGEYLHRKFVGRSVCSYSMASGTGLLVTRSHAWDSELLATLGVRAEQLPPLGDLRDSVQGLQPEFAGRWPALRAVPWFPAVGDGVAANVGSGCATQDRWALSVGTSSAIRAIMPVDSIVPPAGLWLYLLDARRGVLGGALSEGGNLFAWLENTLRLPVLADAELLIADLPPDGHGLTILPFPSGERSLGWHAEARMTVSGIQLHTSPADLLRAGFEALAYQIGVVYAQLGKALLMREQAPMLIGSGGALCSSPTLQQVVADALNVPLSISREREASSRGVALLALEALGVIPDVAQVPPDIAATISPDAERHAIYSRAITRQQQLYAREFS
ncbi:MAG: gluconokinase [Chloroflexota bacterium]|nr:gluconokinase [Chloroflexota bacterium]